MIKTKRAHKARKTGCIYIIRSILLNINDRFETDNTHYGITINEFQTYIYALIDLKIIKKIKIQPKTTIDYVVVNEDKFLEWSKPYFYKIIDKLAMSLIEVGLNVAINKIIH